MRRYHLGATDLIELGRPMRLGQLSQAGMPPACPGGATPSLTMVGTNQVWQCPGQAAGGAAPAGAPPQNLLACPIGGGYYDLQYTEGVAAGQSVTGTPLTREEVEALAFQENIQWAAEGQCGSALQAPAALPPAGGPVGGQPVGGLPGGMPIAGGFPGSFEVPAFLIVPARRVPGAMIDPRTGLPVGAEGGAELPPAPSTAGRLAAVGGLGAAIFGALALGGALG